MSAEDLPVPLANQEHLRLILDSARDFAVVALDLEGRVTTWSAGAEILFGWTAAEALGQPGEMIFTPEDRADGAPEREMGNARREGRATDERWHLRHDGSRFWASGVLTAMREGDHGDLLGYVKVARDLTAQREVEERLRRSEQRHRLALEGAKLATFSRELPDGVMHWNAELKTIFGWAPDEEVTFEGFLSRLHPEDREVTRRAILAAQAGSGLYDQEYRILVPSPDPAPDAPATTVRWLHAIGRSDRDERTGTLTRFDGVAVDVTERKRAALEAAGRERRLEELTRALRFLNTLDEDTREIPEPEVVMAVVARRLGEHLRVSRCAYAEVEADGETFTIRHDYTDGCISTVGEYRLSLFGPRAAADQRAGRTLVIADVDAELPEGAGRETFAAINIRAIVCCPLVKAGRLAAMMAVHQTTPRPWTPGEVELVESVVVRSWAYIERARANARLRLSEEQLRAAIASGQLATWRFNTKTGRFTHHTNLSALFGVPEGDVEVATPMAAIHPEDRPQVDAALQRAQTAANPFEADFRVVWPDGSIRWLAGRATVRREADGSFTYTGANADVTARLQAERAVREARDQAETANRLKDEFLATLSHELRTPLNAILGWAQMMRVDPTDVETRHTAIEIIERNTRAQVQLIEDLLDVSRITSGKMRLEVGPVDLEAVVRAALESLQPTAVARGLRVDAVLDPDAGPVSGDPARLQQVVWNLLSNAVKFTPKGGRVQVRLVQVASVVQITVADTGAGIAADFLPHLFERFRQADSSSRRAHTGLGLGLALVRHLVELHGGRVTAASDGPGRGSTFTVSLPVALARPAARPGLPGAAVSGGAATGNPPVHLRPLEGLRVVAVDDDADARALLRAALSRAGAEITVAPDATSGLEAVRRERPDVLLCDIEMPGEDGYELIAKVRALGVHEGGTVPAVAVTAYARAEDRRRALAAGFQRHLAKPVEPDELILVVAGLAGRAPRGMTNDQ